MTSAETTSPSATGAQFAIEARRLQNPVNLYLEVLDNFSPVGYRQVGKYPHQKNVPYNITDPEKALPRILGLGGEPSKQIDLAIEMKRLSNAEPEAMKHAIEQVQARFDTKQFVTVVSDKHKKGFGGHVYQFLGAAEEHKLDERIATMAAKLQQGYSPKGADEKRIAYALTAAYLDQSGQLQRWINAQPGYVNYEKRLDQLGIHNTAELVGYIKERGDAWGLVGRHLTNGTIELDELEKIKEAGQLLGKTVTYTQNAGSNDRITLGDGHGVTSIKVKLDPSIRPDPSIQRGH